MGEAGDGFAGASLEGGQHVGVPHHRVHAGLTLGAEGQEPFHRDIAETPGRFVGDAQQVHIVVRIHERLQVGEDVLDFAAVEEALTADQPVSDPRLAQGRFDGS